MVVSLRPVVRTIGKPRPIQFPSGICLNAGYLSIRPALIKTAIWVDVAFVWKKSERIFFAGRLSGRKYSG